jgi:endonuclease III
VESDRLITLKDQLIKEGYEELDKPPAFIEFTGVHEADELLNDLNNYPHAYVIGCIMDRQIKAEKAWIIPYMLKQRLGTFEFADLARIAETNPEMIEHAMLHPTALHWLSSSMYGFLIAAIERVRSHYHDNAAEIWADNPSSAGLVRRFLEFRGVGPKIASMAVNILVREFHIGVRDRYSVDISVDTQVKRVFTRMGFAPEDASIEYFIFRARELHPEYPGIFDLALWNLGRKVCKPKQPLCSHCKYAKLCAYARNEEERTSQH